MLDVKLDFFLPFAAKFFVFYFLTWKTPFSPFPTHTEVMLQTVCMSPELLVNQNSSENETCGYSPGQGSPLPGETASPKSSFQQSPSLPDSGLTELNIASPEIYPTPPRKPQEMSAPTGKIKSLFAFSILCCFCKAKKVHCLTTPSVPAESCANSNTHQVSMPVTSNKDAWCSLLLISCFYFVVVCCWSQKLFPFVKGCSALHGFGLSLAFCCSFTIWIASLVLNLTPV